MIDVFKFILKLVADFIKMLFTIDVGNGLSLGLLMCVIFIFLPLVLTIVNFLKVVVVDEVDEKYDLFKKENDYIPKHTYLYKAKHRKK